MNIRILYAKNYEGQYNKLLYLKLIEENLAHIF